MFAARAFCPEIIWNIVFFAHERLDFWLYKICYPVHNFPLIKEGKRQTFPHYANYSTDYSASVSAAFFLEAAFFLGFSSVSTSAVSSAFFVFLAGAFSATSSSAFLDFALLNAVPKISPSVAPLSEDP